MSSIRILPEIISNKIAAGEVVERPASVVKELVENALDAGSERILVEVEKGGRALIRVSDNGSGMSRDDALLSLERYATSKIFSDQDLFSIRTLGFRGEALPSIASVSRFTLVTREAESDAGTEIKVDGGKIKQVADAGAPPGTLIAVKQLFFNTPARRKFLKSIGTEMGHIAEVVSSIALSRPDVHFTLIRDGRKVKDWTAADQKDRVFDILGREVGSNLVSVEKTAEGYAVNGWIGSPRVSRRTYRSVFVFVNGRYVKDRMIQHALFGGYSQRLVKGQYPLAVLFVTVPFDQMDVNVHPTKSEVKFAKHRLVHDLVQSAVTEALRGHDRHGWTLAASSIAEQQAAYRPSTVPLAERFERREPGEAPAGPAAGYKLDTVGVDRTFENRTPASSTRPKAGRTQETIWPKRKFADLRVAGQVMNTYLVCESSDGLILIDQHAAHERIVYEKLKNRSAERSTGVQKLLVPETVELGFREAGILRKLLPDFQALGLEIEPFGGETFVVKAVPSLLAGREIQPLILEITEKLAAGELTPGLDQALDECLKIMACHSAIRARQDLKEKQLEVLLKELDECENPSHCPHGRPTWIQWNVRELDKLFNRIV